VAFNPDYVPSGPNNARNPYNAKINNVKLSRSQVTARGFNTEGGTDPGGGEEPAAGLLTADGRTFIDANGNTVIPAT